MRSTEIVIVGGGIAGISLALSLAERGFSDVTLLERGLLGSGATGASAGGVRQQFSSPLEIELSVRALRFWREAESRFDHPCPFTQHGYLFVTSRPAVLDQLADAAELQHRLGAGPVSILGAEAIADHAPWLRTGAFVGGSWSPEDGRIVPSDAVAAIAAAARRAGVRILQGWEVRKVATAGTGWLVEGDREAISCEQVVVAAGTWTPSLLEPLGHAVDIRPWYLHFGVTAPALPGMPLASTIDLDTGMSVKREGPGLCVGVNAEDTPAHAGPWTMLEEFATVASERAPALLDIPVVTTTSGVADLSVDGHPYVGGLEPGLWVIAGFGGHGTMHGPVVADLLAGQIAGEPEPALDLTPFDPSRTTSGRTPEWLVASRKEADR